MEDRVKKHFDEFYNRLVFLDSHLGEKEQTMQRDFFFTVKEDSSGKIVRSLVFEENIKDEQIYIRHKGLVLTLVYGSFYNKKYKKLNVYIDKDPYYKGNEESNIDELLSLMDEYISNHYKRFLEKINKVIYGSRYDENISVKYRPANILSRDNIRDIKIRNAIVKNKDIEHMRLYPNLKEINLDHSVLNGNLGGIPLSSIIIANSEIKDMVSLDHISTKLLFIYNSKFISSIPRSITVDCESLHFSNISNIRFADLFLCTNFRNTTKATFDDMELNSIEVSLLPVLYLVVELEAYGEAESFDFLKELPELEYFKGFIKIISDKVLERLKINFKDKLDKYNIKERDRVNNYIFYQLTDVLKKYKTFYDSIRLSKLALVKFKGIIEQSDDEYVKKILALPLSKRKHLGEERDINFIEPLSLDPFNLMLDNINKQYLSKIVGRDGKQLIKPDQLAYTYIYYILGPDGNILESVRKTEARDVTVPEHYEEVRNDIVENNNNIFDYYYNREYNEPTKLAFLSQKIKDYFNPLIEGFESTIASNRALIEKRDQLKELDKSAIEDSLWESINLAKSVLFTSPRHKYVEKIGYRNGEQYSYLDTEEDDFTLEDANLLSAIYRTRDAHILDFSLSEIFEEKNFSIEKQESIKRGVNGLINIWNTIDELNKQIIDEDILIARFVEEKYASITELIKSSDYVHWFISDIEKFLQQFNLGHDDYEILYNYILILQCRYKLDYKLELGKLVDREFVLKECYSVDSTISYITNFTDFVDYETSLKDGFMSQNEYDLVKEFLENTERQDKIKEILDINRGARKRAYVKMMPLIDSLSVGQLKEIKDKMVITDELCAKFDKFVDYLYFFLYQSLPPWMELELIKCPHLEKKYTSTSIKRLVPESTFHIDENVEIERGPFAF